MFINLTPNTIRIRGVDLTTYEDRVLEVPPSGTVACCTARLGQVQEHHIDEFAYTRSRTLSRVLLSNGQQFPNPELGKVFLVSSMVQAALSRDDVLAPDTGPTAIQDHRGNVWAVTQLIGP